MRDAWHFNRNDLIFLGDKNLVKKNWNGKNILMLGAARQGQALVRFMATHGAHVTLSDSKPFDQLTDARQDLSDLPIRWEVGGHPLSLLDGNEIVFVTGGVDLRIPFLKEARRRNLPILNDTEVFLQEVSAPLIGITGSSGKTTTTTLVGRIAEKAAADNQTVYVGGNIGNPLLTLVDQILPTDLVILELSSFQLELVTHSPAIAAVLNITPNHLDRHETMDAYIAAKANILRNQKTGDWAVLNRNDQNSWDLRRLVQGNLISFGWDAPTDEAQHAVFMQDDTVMLRMKGQLVPVLTRAQVALRGDHNLYNVMAACAIAAAAGFSADAMRAGVEHFSGVPHRLQFVREYHGARWYNDSIATAPERTLAALHSFSEPLIVLLGGRDKKLPWVELAKEIHKRARAAVLFGEARDLIETALLQEQPENATVQIEKAESLPEAIQKAAALCRSGDVVLLSPGGTSYDAFKDFEERGKVYSEWVMRLN